MTVRVVIADDQRVVREGLALLVGLLPGVELVGTAEDGERALDLVRKHTPDVVLMDLRMPLVDGVEATRRIGVEHPSTEVIVLTTYADDESVFAALQAGARGYLLKRSPGGPPARPSWIRPSRLACWTGCVTSRQASAATRSSPRPSTGSPHARPRCCG